MADCFYQGDKRPILGIWFDDGKSGWKVGRNGVTSIRVDHTNGQGATVPWFAVYQGETLAAHVNAAHIAWVNRHEIPLDALTPQ